MSSDDYQTSNTASSTTGGNTSSLARGQVLSGTISNFTNQGEYLTLTTTNGQWLVDPEEVRADRLGLQVGQAIRVQVTKLDDGQKIKTYGIARADGTPVLGTITSPVTNGTSGQSTTPGMLPLKTKDQSNFSESDWDDITGQWFNKSDYLAKAPDVARSQVSAFRHYIEHGAVEGRAKQLFDENFYLQSNADVKQAKIAGVIPSGWEHFVRHGAAEGRQSAPGILPTTVRDMAQTFQSLPSGLNFGDLV